MSHSSVDGHVEAYRSSGSSPGRIPSLHLVGPGAVGRSLLRQLDPARIRLVAVSDSYGTRASSLGLDPKAVAQLKERTGRVSPTPTPLTVDLLHRIDADIVVDTTATQLGRAPWYDLLQLGVLERGRHLVLAAKDALQARVDRWTSVDSERVRYDAVLGGAGSLLRAELPALREHTLGCAIAGNATTTAIVTTIEGGGSLEDGIEAAREAELLEADPELDFRGVDAAVKLAIVAGALLQKPIDPLAIPCDDVRDLDPEIVRTRARAGATTRLVGRLCSGEGLAVRFEEVAPASPLDVPIDRVAYLYDLGGERSRLHVGDGLGAPKTAEAVLRDMLAIATELAAEAEVTR